MMIAPPTLPEEPAIAQAASELLARYGCDAIGEAAARAVTLASDGRWPEHDLALRVLSALERLTGRGR